MRAAVAFEQPRMLHGKDGRAADTHSTGGVYMAVGGAPPPPRDPRRRHRRGRDATEQDRRPRQAASVSMERSSETYETIERDI